MVDLKLLGGALALDFVNTRDPLYGDDAREYLDTPSALREWARHVGLAARVSLDDDDLARALDVRALLERLFTRPSRTDLARFPRVYAEALAGATLVPGRQELVLRPGGGVDAILLPVLESARELLLGPDRDRVKQCGAPDCGWLFVDRSRNASRRWCRMDGCGAREKMRRYRARSA